MSWNWMFRNVLIGFPVRRLFPTHLVGAEHLPKQGPFILALGPHMTELESAIVASVLRQYEVRFFAKAEYWQKSRLVSWFMTSTGQIPLTRTDARAAVEQIQRGVEVLRAGGIVALYPEGTRGEDGKLHKGHTGVVRTSLQAGGVPIVPVGLIGMAKLNPPGKRLPRPGRNTIVIGEPIHPLALNNAEQHKVLEKALEGALARPVTNQLMQAIARLAGTEQADGGYLTIGSAGTRSPK